MSTAPMNDMHIISFYLCFDGLLLTRRDSTICCVLRMCDCDLCVLAISSAGNLCAPAFCFHHNLIRFQWHNRNEQRLSNYILT